MDPKPEDRTEDSLEAACQRAPRQPKGERTHPVTTGQLPGKWGAASLQGRFIPCPRTQEGQVERSLLTEAWTTQGQPGI